MMDLDELDRQERTLHGRPRRLALLPHIRDLIAAARERDRLRGDVKRLAAHAQYNHECCQRAEGERDRLRDVLAPLLDVLAEADRE